MSLLQWLQRGIQMTPEEYEHEYEEEQTEEMEDEYVEITTSKSTLSPVHIYLAQGTIHFIMKTVLTLSINVLNKVEKYKYLNMIPLLQFYLRQLEEHWVLL